MRKTASDAVKSVYGKIDPSKREYTFEIFGLDFMIDEQFQVFLNGLKLDLAN
jgi:tubulin--tyrosine ligase